MVQTRVRFDLYSVHYGDPDKQKFRDKCDGVMMSQGLEEYMRAKVKTECQVSG